jgi:hypothetical protein
LRDQHQTALADFTKAKQVYETTAANLGAASNKIEQVYHGALIAHMHVTQFN